MSNPTTLKTVKTTFGEVAAPNQETARVVIEQDRAALYDLGFAVEPPLYEIGANAGSWTAEGYLTQQSDFERKAWAGPGLHDFANLIKREERRDFKVKTSDLVFLEDGRLVTPHGEFGTEVGAFQHLAGFLPARFAAGFLSSVKAGLRAYATNELLSDPRMEDRELVLRTRIARDGQDRGIYAIVSPTYQAFNLDRVAEAVTFALEQRDALQGARLDATYDGSKGTLRVLWFNYHGTEAAGCGDIFKFGVMIEAADDKSSAIHVKLVAYQNRCLNYITIGESLLDLGRKVHAGNRSMNMAVASMIDAAASNASGFVQRWAEASKEDLVKVLQASGPEEAFKKLVKRGYGVAAGIKPEEMVARLMQAWQFNPGYQRTNFVDALTRAAHTNRWASPWARQEIEEQAANLVFVRNLN